MHVWKKYNRGVGPYPLRVLLARAGLLMYKKKVASGMDLDSGFGIEKADFLL